MPRSTRHQHRTERDVGALHIGDNVRMSNGDLDGRESRRFMGWVDVSGNPVQAYARWIEMPRVPASHPRSWAQPSFIIPGAGAEVLLCWGGVTWLMTAPLTVRVVGAVVLLAGLVWTAVLIGYFLRPPTKV